MTDLISREETIEDIERFWNSISGLHPHLDETMALYADIKRIVKKRPSAYPKKGKWIKADSQQYFRKHYPLFTCSACGYRKDSQKKWNFCPNCGADMRESE